MNVSCADIIIVYNAVFAEPMGDNVRFGLAADMIRAERPSDWRDLFTTSMSERLRNPGLKYPALTAIVKRIHNLA